LIWYRVYLLVLYYQGGSSHISTTMLLFYEYKAVGKAFGRTCFLISCCAHLIWFVWA
jgi:hypothetical protein